MMISSARSTCGYKGAMTELQGTNVQFQKTVNTSHGTSNLNKQCDVYLALKQCNQFSGQGLDSGIYVVTACIWRCCMHVCCPPGSH
jgi:hypothetical protein